MIGVAELRGRHATALPSNRRRAHDLLGQDHDDDRRRSGRNVRNDPLAGDQWKAGLPKVQLRQQLRLPTTQLCSSLAL